MRKKQVENIVEILFSHPFKKDVKRSHDSTQYDTAGRLTQRSFIMRGDWLGAVIYVLYPQKFKLLSKNLTKLKNS